MKKHPLYKKIIIVLFVILMAVIAPKWIFTGVANKGYIPFKEAVDRKCTNPVNVYAGCLRSEFLEYVKTTQDLNAIFFASIELETRLKKEDFGKKVSTAERKLLKFASTIDAMFLVENVINQRLKSGRTDGVIGKFQRLYQANGAKQFLSKLPEEMCLITTEMKNLMKDEINASIKESVTPIYDRATDSCHSIGE